MYSSYYERDIVLNEEEKAVLFDIYETVAKDKGFDPDYDPENRDYIDFEQDTELLDTILYHVETFGKEHPEFTEISHVFESESNSKPSLDSIIQSAKNHDTPTQNGRSDELSI